MLMRFRGFEMFCEAFYVLSIGSHGAPGFDVAWSVLLGFILGGSWVVISRVIPRGSYPTRFFGDLVLRLGSVV